MRHADGSVKHPGLDNHGMGTIFEELVRPFNEENNEEAGEHWTPRDAVRFRPPRSATMPSSSTHMHSVRLAKQHDKHGGPSGDTWYRDHSGSVWRKPRITGHRVTVANIVIWHERLGKSA